MSGPDIGISALATYLPPFRVRLRDWCNWTGDSWNKVAAVVGSSFRMRADDENAYTMAATAVLRLIENNNIDPSRIGMLALGTESSTDNSAGAVIVKGMLNRELTRRGQTPISRACEVPEFKHACLGGVYAMKAAARYLAWDGRDRLAIVVCSDIAEYERGTSGEVTQGAGAVAMLVERDPQLLGFEMELSGSASDYRGPDFRKPFSRFVGQELSANAQPRDFPVFNGKYSTTCYVDEVLAAMGDMFGKLKTAPSTFMRELKAVFLHRPYHRMAETGLVMSLLYAFALGDDSDQAMLDEIARLADVDGRALAAELTAAPSVYHLVESERTNDDVFPLAMKAARELRSHEPFQSNVTGQLRLGGEEMAEIGNLYTASLPAWLAAGFEQADREGLDLTGERILTIGYGSGDAAEIIPMRVMPGWRESARRLHFAEAFSGGIDLDQAGYEALHDRGESDALALLPTQRFRISRVGDRSGHIDDSGIEYYDFVGGENRLV